MPTSNPFWSRGIDDNGATVYVNVGQEIKTISRAIPSRITPQSGQWELVKPHGQGTIKTRSDDLEILKTLGSLL